MISIVYMVIFDFLTILCKEGMSYYGIFGCSRKNADISEKNAWSADFTVENYFWIVGPYLCQVPCPGSEGFSIYMGGGGGLLSPPPPPHVK